MLEELVRLFLCLATGEVLAHAGVPCPGPVLGLVILYGDLLILNRLPDALGSLSAGFLNLLGMLFVPAGVGILNFGPLFRNEAAPIIAAVFCGTLLTFAITLVVATHLFKAQMRRAAVKTQGAAHART